MMLTQELTIPSILSYFSNLKGEGSFGPEEYPQIDAIVSEIGRRIRSESISKEEVQEISYSFGEPLLNDTLQGMALLKPFGYAGDYMMIDKIYTQHCSENIYHKSWDKYFHSQSAPIAVRNRKEYFKNLIQSKLKDLSSLDLLNVASGPARDLKEVYSELKSGENIQTRCIEMDEKAIEYAKGLNKDYLDRIEFINSNILRHRDNKKYDIIWSAGLFDYFNDKAFLIILKRFKDWIKNSGEIIIGNFNEDHNPSRDYMEICGEWFLNHRTEEKLFHLAKESGFDDDQISIGREKENVNLFLHLKLS